jgi:hypothetical protein
MRFEMAAQLASVMDAPVREKRSEEPAASGELGAAFARMKAAYRRDPNPSYETRIQNLDKLLQLVRDHQGRIF